jgi:hypothetical protein
MQIKGLITLLLISATPIFFPTKLYANAIIECNDCTSVELKEKVELYVLQQGLSNGEYVVTLFDPVIFSIQDAVAKVVKVVKSEPNGGFGGMPSLGMDTSVTVNLVQKSAAYLETERKLRSHHVAISYMKRMVVETFDSDPSIFLKPGGPLDSVADALKDKTSTGYYLGDQMKKHSDLGPENSGGQLDVNWGSVIDTRLSSWLNSKLGYGDSIFVYAQFPDGTIGELKITVQPGRNNFYEVTVTGQAWFANGEMLILNPDMLAANEEITPDMINILSLVGLMNTIDELNVSDPNGVGIFGALGAGLGGGSGCVRIIDFLTDPLTGSKIPYIATSC